MSLLKCNLLTNEISRSANRLSIAQQFMEDLKATIQQENMSTGKPSTFYKPSSLGCTRNMYYQRLGTDFISMNTPSGIGICESGTDRHIRIQNYIQKMHNHDIDCEWVDVAEYVKEKELDDIEIISQNGNETKLFNKRLQMRFLCDGVVKYNGIYYIVEIKTETSTKFNNRTGIEDYHEVQAVAYSESLQIDRVIFIYENRDFCDIKTYTLYVTPEMKSTMVVDKIAYCEECIREHKLPEIPANLNVKLCRNCDYAVICKRDTARAKAVSQDE